MTPGNELDELVLSQVALMGAALEQQPGEGYYIILGVSLVNYHDPKTKLLNRLLYVLSGMYPQYRWWTTESWGGSDVRVNWRLK